MAQQDAAQRARLEKLEAQEEFGWGFTFGTIAMDLVLPGSGMAARMANSVDKQGRTEQVKEMVGKIVSDVAENCQGRLGEAASQLEAMTEQMDVLLDIRACKGAAAVLRKMQEQGLEWCNEITSEILGEALADEAMGEFLGELIFDALA